MLPQLLYPQGNFLNIKDTASSPTDYNINVTKDLVENLPGGVVKDVFAPAFAASLSLPYDAIQASTRTTESDIGRAMQTAGMSGPRDIMAEAEGLSYARENPLSTAIERTIGAAGPLAERLSNNNRTLTVNDLIGLNYSNLRNPISLRQDINRNQPFLDSSNPQPEFFPNNQQGSLNVDMGATGTIPTATNINAQPLIGETSGIAPLLQQDMDFGTSVDNFQGFTDKQVFSKPTTPKKGEGLKGLLSLALSLAAPGAGLLMRGPKGLAGLNRRIQQSDFGQATSLVDYFNTVKNRRFTGQNDPQGGPITTFRNVKQQTQDRIDDRGRGQIPTKTTSAPAPKRQARQTAGKGGLHSGY